MKNNEKREQLAKAFDSGSMSGKLVDLNEEQAVEFFSIIEDQSAFLKKIRSHLTTEATGTLGKITAEGKFLKPWTYNAKNGTDSEYTATPVEYATRLVRGSFTVYDSEIRNNIEKEGLETTLLGIVAKQIANDYEHMALYGRKRSGAVDVDGLIDGVLFRALENGVVVDASSTALFADRYVSRDKFRKVQKSFPNYLAKDAHWFVSENVMMDYEDLYTTVADYRVRDELQVRIAKKPTVECSLLSDDSACLESGGASTTIASGAGAINTAGQDQIEVASVTGLVVGDSISINYGLETEQNFTITGITSTTLTLDADLAYTVSVGNTVKEVTLDGADCIFGDPMNMIRVQQTGRGTMTFEAERIASVGWRWHYTGNVDFIVLHNEKLGLLRNMLVR